MPTVAPKTQESPNSTIYYRLIALWVLGEAMVGGVIHGFKIPVSGLVVGSWAVICICLMGWYVARKGAILKATIIVAIFKMMLSPQAPPTAYIAVFFQGLLGELLFRNKKSYALSCLLLAVLALLESGLQRILVLTLVYGDDLWKAINSFLSKLTGQKTITNYSLLIGGGYVLLHLIAGFVIGWWASVLPKRIKNWSEKPENIIQLEEPGSIALPAPSKRKKRIKKGLLIIWILLILLYLQSYLKIGTPLLPSHISLKIFIRSIIIVLAWYFIVGPLLKQLLHYWLQKRKAKSQKDVQVVMELLPATQDLIIQSWRRSTGKRRWKRIIACSKMVLVNALSQPLAQPVFILTAPIQTGKTTSLVNWSEERNDVFGILTPVVNGKRVFMNAHTREQFPMEATTGEKEVLTVGRFTFSIAGFNKAIEIIRNAMNSKGWLVIDEIGLVELRDEGFSGILKGVLQNKNDDRKLLLVVREGMAEEVKSVFQINNAGLIKDISELK